jgi:hypothetical protein
VAQPGVAVYRRLLEKMAVPSQEVATVRAALIAQFTTNSLQYITAADFPAKLVAQQRRLQAKIKAPAALSTG